MAGERDLYGSHIFKGKKYTYKASLPGGVNLYSNDIKQLKAEITKRVGNGWKLNGAWNDFSITAPSSEQRKLAELRKQAAALSSRPLAKKDRRFKATLPDGSNLYSANDDDLKRLVTQRMGGEHGKAWNWNSSNGFDYTVGKLAGPKKRKTATERQAERNQRRTNYNNDAKNYGLNSRDDVRKLLRILLDMGYTHLKNYAAGATGIDGYFGPLTSSAYLQAWNNPQLAAELEKKGYQRPLAHSPGTVKVGNRRVPATDLNMKLAVKVKAADEHVGKEYSPQALAGFYTMGVLPALSITNDLATAKLIASGDYTLGELMTNFAGGYNKGLYEFSGEKGLEWYNLHQPEGSAVNFMTDILLGNIFGDLANMTRGGGKGIGYESGQTPKLLEYRYPTPEIVEPEPFVPKGLIEKGPQKPIYIKPNAPAQIESKPLSIESKPLSIELNPLSIESKPLSITAQKSVPVTNALVVELGIYKPLLESESVSAADLRGIMGREASVPILISDFPIAKSNRVPIKILVPIRGQIGYTETPNLPIKANSNLPIEYVYSPEELLPFDRNMPSNNIRSYGLITQYAEPLVIKQPVYNPQQITGGTAVVKSPNFDWSPKVLVLSGPYQSNYLRILGGLSDGDIIGGPIIKTQNFQWSPNFKGTYNPNFTIMGDLRLLGYTPRPNFGPLYYTNPGFSMPTLTDIVNEHYPLYNSPFYLLVPSPFWTLGGQGAPLYNGWRFTPDLNDLHSAEGF